MKDQAARLSPAAEAKIRRIQDSGVALRVAWFGMEGTWPGTRFDLVLRRYLLSYVDGAQLRSRFRGQHRGAREDGARAIGDVACHFDWRPGAARAILFLGDDALDAGGGRVEEADVQPANNAVAAAKSAGITIHTYFGTCNSPHRDQIRDEYARLAHETGGVALSSVESPSSLSALPQQAAASAKRISMPNGSGQVAPVQLDSEASTGRFGAGRFGAGQFGCGRFQSQVEGPE